MLNNNGLRLPRNYKNLFIISVLIILVIFIFESLKTPSPPPSSQIPSTPPSVTSEAKSLSGFYKGQLPCADCPGIDETLVLASDGKKGTFILEDVYREKPNGNFKIDGTWTSQENILKLIPNDNSQTKFFQILGNGNLEMLDSDMKKIDSSLNQILTKQN